MPKLGLQIIHINLVPHTKFQLFFMSLRNIFGTTHFYDQMVFFYHSATFLSTNFLHNFLWSWFMFCTFTFGFVCL